MTDTAHRHKWACIKRVDYCHFYWQTLACLDPDCTVARRHVRVERKLDADGDYFDYLFARPESCSRCAELMGAG